MDHEALLDIEETNLLRALEAVDRDIEAEEGAKKLIAEKHTKRLRGMAATRTEILKQLSELREGMVHPGLDFDGVEGGKVATGAGVEPGQTGIVANDPTPPRPVTDDEEDGAIPESCPDCGEPTAECVCGELVAEEVASDHDAEGVADYNAPDEEQEETDAEAPPAPTRRNQRRKS